MGALPNPSIKGLWVTPTRENSRRLTQEQAVRVMAMYDCQFAWSGALTTV